jgi:hypothetical protein
VTGCDIMYTANLNKVVLSMKWNLTIRAVAQEFIISLNWRIPVVKEIHWRIPVNTHEEKRTLEEFQFLYLTPEKISFKISITRLPPKNSTQKFAYSWGIPRLKIFHLMPAELQAGIAKFVPTLWHKCSYTQVDLGL